MAVVASARWGVSFSGQMLPLQCGSLHSILAERSHYFCPKKGNPSGEGINQ